MYYAARIAKEKYPDAKIVFVGPCVAKRKEAQRDEAVDFVMTFEEVSSIFDAFEVNLEIVQPYAMEFSSVREAHGVCTSWRRDGSRKGILENGSGQNQCHTGIRFKQEEYRNITCIRKIGKSSRTVHRSDGLRGGCITGPSTHSGSNGKRQLVQELAKQEKTY
mgnify:CR=1 FL=1